MPKINQRLLKRIQDTSGLSQRAVYARISRKVAETHLPRRLAAIALAGDLDINISPFADDSELAEIRHAAPPSRLRMVATPTVASSVPQSNGPRPMRKPRPAHAKSRGNTVFVVHGRNEDARKAMFDFLRSLGIRPIEWTQAIKKTRQPSPYVGDILEAAFRDAAAVVVMLTADDEARLKEKYWKAHDPVYEKELTGQARANVLFEAGMAFGRNPNSTVLVQIGEVRPFSDVAGRHIVHLTNTASSRQEFATKLSNAGCNVDVSGTDWLSTGDFDL